MQKKFLGILLALCIVLVSPSVFAADADVTEIGTADELIALMGDNTKWADSYKLTADIDLTGLTQNGIGDSTTPFSGTFDGDGHTVKGLNVTNGLFGVISGATVKNLTVEGAVNATTANAGGIVGFISNNGTVENCVNKAKIISTSNQVGGIVGRVTGVGASGVVEIIDCVNMADIDGVSNAAGIVGRFDLGGDGKNGTYNVKNCANYGTITAKEVSGGIIGLYSNNASGCTSYIENNLNAGNVVATGEIIAGISGYFRVYEQSMTVVIRNNMNVGNVSTTGSGMNIGGIIGVGNAKAGAYTLAYNYNASLVSNANNKDNGVIASYLSANATVANNYALEMGVYGNTDFVTMVGKDNYTSAETFAGFSAEYWIFTDKGPELKTHHEHDLDAKYVVVEDGHALSCYCNDASTFGQTEAHVYVDMYCSYCGKVDCSHSDTTEVVTKTPNCVEVGYKNVVCTNCATVLNENIVIEIDPANHEGNAYIHSDSGLVCANCKAATAAPATDAIITVSPVAVLGKEVTVTVSVKALSPIMVAYFKVNAPDGFTLTSAEALVGNADATSSGFALTMQEKLTLPYEAAVLNMSMQEATVDAAVLKLTFTVDDTVEKGTHVLTVESLETYNYAEETVETASVSAEVTITETTAVAGDIDGDGRVTVKDVLLLARAIVNGRTVGNGDVNGDKKVNLLDVVNIVQLIAQ